VRTAAVEGPGIELWNAQFRPTKPWIITEKPWRYSAGLRGDQSLSTIAELKGDKLAMRCAQAIPWEAPWRRSPRSAYGARARLTWST